jgi:hypothetical protein
MGGVCISYLQYLDSGAGVFRFSAGWLLLTGGGGTLLGIFLEAIRPYRAFEGQPVEEGDGAFESELAGRLGKDSSFVYWDYQNPLYVTLLTTALPLALFVSAVFSWFSEPWASLVLVFVGALLIVPHGGQRTLVTRQGLTVRWGLGGIRVLRLNSGDIIAAELHEFSPLRDFGGYGIRFNREMKAYYLRGTRGVKISTTRGKKYLIGSDHPERLLSIVQAAAGGVNR